MMIGTQRTVTDQMLMQVTEALCHRRGGASGDTDGASGIEENSKLQLKEESYHYFDPEPNLMILFPSWLKHDVEPNQSDEERISVAFNFVVDYNSITKLAVSRD
jgi:hypothetical protein